MSRYEIPGQTSFFDQLVWPKSEASINYLESLPDILNCLTIRQPWANLIVGTQDISRTKLQRLVEIRSWKPKLRLPFPLVIHAGLTYTDQERLIANRLQIGSDVRGAIIGIVEVYEIEQVTAERWEELRLVSFEPGEFPGGLTFAWHLRSPWRLEKPIPRKGQLGLFKIDKQTLTSS